MIRLPFTLSDTSDYYSSLIILDMLKGGYTTKNFENSIMEGSSGYPALAHYLLSLFPEKLWGLAGLWLNIVYDIISILFLYLITTYLGLNQFFSNYHLFTPAFYVALLFSTTPTLFGSKARLMNFGGRTFGLFFSILFFVLIGIALIEKSPLTYLLASIPVILITISSQFALQNITFISIFLSIIYLSPGPILTIILSIGTGYIIPQLKIKEFWYFKRDHYNFYAHFVDKGTTATGRSLFGLSTFKKLSLSDIKTSFELLLNNYPKIGLLVLLLENPIIIASILLFAMPGQKISYINSNPYLGYIVAIILSTFVVFVITSVGIFRIFGQSERYFEYASPWLALVFVYLSAHAGSPERINLALLLINLAMNSFLFFIAQQGQIRKKYFLKLPEIEDLMSFLKNSVNEKKILVLPVKKAFELGHFAISMQTRHKFYYKRISIPGKPGGQHYIEDLAHADWPKKDLITMLDKYAIDLIILEKLSYTYKFGGKSEYDFSIFNKVHEDPYFEVYSYEESITSTKKTGNNEGTL